MYKHILHATDLSTQHYDACVKARDIAQHFHAQLFLLHVIEPPTSLQIAQGLGFAEFDDPHQIQKDAQAVMRTLGEALNISAKHQYVEVGSIKTHILQKIKELGCDLLIVGDHISHHLPACLEHSAHHMEDHVLCDVLTLKR